MPKHLTMREIPGTSHDPQDPPYCSQFTRLLAPKTAPVFEAEAAEPAAFTEVVAIVCRNEEGLPVHGGLFGVAGKHVTSLALRDLEDQIDTSREPAHVALGLLLMRGPLVFRQGGVDQIMPLSILDLSIAAPALEQRSASARAAWPHVEAFYRANVLPETGLLPG